MSLNVPTNLIISSSPNPLLPAIKPISIEFNAVPHGGKHWVHSLLPWTFCLLAWLEYLQRLESQIVHV